jgi:hypothetical protein
MRTWDRRGQEDTMTELRPGMKVEITTSYAATPTAALEDVAAALTGLRDKLDGTRAAVQEWAGMLERAPVRTRPCNRMYQAGETPCHATDGVVRCLAQKDHTGDHVGYGSGRRWHNDSDDDVLDDWEQELLSANDEGVSFAEIAAKFRPGMYGWFERYPDRPLGNSVLCAACAGKPGEVERMLDRTEKGTRSYPWDGFTALRPIDPAQNNPGHGFVQTREWTCCACYERGWPET